MGAGQGIHNRGATTTTRLASSRKSTPTPKSNKFRQDAEEKCRTIRLCFKSDGRPALVYAPFRRQCGTLYMNGGFLTTHIIRRNLVHKSHRKTRYSLFHFDSYEKFASNIIRTLTNRTVLRNLACGRGCQKLLQFSAWQHDQRTNLRFEIWSVWSCRGELAHRLSWRVSPPPSAILVLRHETFACVYLVL